MLNTFESDDPNYRECAKLGTHLKKVRKDRRVYKDIVEELEPIHEFLNNNKNLLNNLGGLVGSVRKAEKYHSNRKYYPRIIKESTDR